MLMPGFSVTLIGLAAAAVAAVSGRGSPGAAVARGVFGAWAGFFAGAVAGVIVDVVLGRGAFLPLVGHGAAVLGAAGALGAGSARRLGAIGPR